MDTRIYSSIRALVVMARHTRSGLLQGDVSAADAQLKRVVGPQTFERLEQLLDAIESMPALPSPIHSDELAVESFAAVMNEKLARKRQDGYGGWSDPAKCTVQHLSSLLRNCVEKGDPVDVGNFCMMLHQRGEKIDRAV